LKKIFPKIILSFLALVLIIPVMSSHIFAQSISDLEQQIQNAAAQKAARQKDLSNAQSLLTSLKNKSYSLSTDLVGLKTQIADFQNQIAQVTTQISALETSITETQKTIDSNKAQRDNEIKQYFIDSYSTGDFDSFIGSNTSISDYQTVSEIKTFSIGTKKSLLDEIAASFVKLSDDKKQVIDLKNQLMDQSKLLDDKRKELEAQIASVNGSISNKTVSVKNIQGDIVNIDANLATLNSTYKRVMDQERANQIRQTPVQSGQYYFSGRGRDLIDGHGMGFAQWGAYGMSLQGWNYSQMINFYYPNTVTSTSYPISDSISIIYCSSNPAEYLNYNWSACGSSGAPLVIQRISMDQYVSGIGEIPSYFGDEVGKAQTIIARTYAVRVTGNGDPTKPICITAQCQVYIPGNTNKAAYNTATRNMVITSGGSAIVAYFSASDRGCSSKLSTVWGSTDQSYITNTHDDPVAYKNYTTNDPYNPGQTIKPYNWQWRTNGYDITQLSHVLSLDPRTNVGTLQSITTSKDVCGRVGLITIVGSAGTKSMTGWTFRAIFNDNMDAAGLYDYVYSTEFSFTQR